jgi:hypothetical protein
MQDAITAQSAMPVILQGDSLHSPLKGKRFMPTYPDEDDGAALARLAE